MDDHSAKLSWRRFSIVGICQFLWCNSRNIIRQLCEEIYFGKDEYFSVNGKAPVLYKGRGLWQQEKPIIDTHWKNFLTSLYFHRKIVERCLLGLNCSDGRISQEIGYLPLMTGAKPSPEGLKFYPLGLAHKTDIFETPRRHGSCKRLGKGKFIYVGKPAENLVTYFRDTKRPARTRFIV